MVDVGATEDSRWTQCIRSKGVAGGRKDRGLNVSGAGVAGGRNNRG